MIGIDIIQVSRVANILSKFSKKFITRVFSVQEIEDSKKYNNHNMVIKHFAKRFAVKESYIKASNNKTIPLKNISTTNNSYGVPIISVNQVVLKNASVSISDDGNYATAIVLLLQ